jgi:aspartyl-tRNA(Asn)/glutamyl-tRNA(Gln) amidotransferase subunit A
VENQNLFDLTAADAARQIRDGAVSPVALLEACLDRIDACDPEIRAWVHVDREGAMRAARERTWEAERGRWAGALHGVPVAIKDIIDVAGLPTTAGAGPFAHRAPDVDAVPVARLRARGAVIMGKVSTTAFAFLDPSPTRNPWNLAHTPGGSSSGSAATVASRMAPLALGTQTVGSVLRPAAYCGVVGFKPSYGRISTAGVVPLAWSLDHVGIFGREVADVALALHVLAESAAPDPQSSIVHAGDVIAAVVAPAAPRIGFPRSLLEHATPEMSAHLEHVADTLAERGAAITDVELPSSYAEIHDSGRTVMLAEAAAAHHDLFSRHAAEYPPGIRAALESGQEVSAVSFLLAQENRCRFRREAAALAARFDALLVPTIGAPAPLGLDSTGDPYFCAPWSSAGMPAITLPSGLASDALPLAIQLVGAPLAEERLLPAATWCERVLAFAHQPVVGE